MKFIYVGELIRTPEAPDHMGIRQGLDWLGWDYKIVDPVLNSPDEVVRQCNEFNADLVLHGNTDSLSQGIIPRIKSKQAFFMGDFQPEEYYLWEQWVKNSQGLDFLLLSNKPQLETWSKAFKAPAYFWPHGCFVPDKLGKDPKFDYDVVFIGTMNDSYPYNKRFELIKEIERKLPYPITYMTEGSVEGRNRIWRDMPKIYHTAKVVLDISHFWDYEGYASGRYWYTAGLGACTVSKRFPGCTEFYKDKLHKWYFDTADEAVQLIMMLMEDEMLREQTKLRAYEHNKTSHNYKIRFQQVLDIYNAHK